MDIRKHNREAWDLQVERRIRWTVPAAVETIAAAKAGRWEIYLTPTKPVPRNWLPDLQGKSVLCLASGGGQQGPILAAAGAGVTVFDNSPRQLDQDHHVANRDGLKLRTIEGDMRDLSSFADGSFDLIIHPVSNTFVPDVRPVWLESIRVLRPGGYLLAGFDNPLVHMLDNMAITHGELRIVHALPYNEAELFSEEEIARRLYEGIPLEFGHTLTDLIGGQIDAGFEIIGFFEDRNPVEEGDLLDRYTATYIAIRARKPCLISMAASG